MIVFPNIKINLGLYITGKRTDGFHNLESIFYPVPFKDALEIIPSDKLSFESNIKLTDDLEQNLCVKAYRLLQSDFELPPVKMYLLKNIPAGAGLGGGSADASFTLMALNELFNLNITDGKLLEYAAALGSDCPFFIVNKPSYVFGRGENIEQVDLDLSDYHFTIIHAGIHISTKVAFANIKPADANIHIYNLPKMPVAAWKNMLRNDFEEFAFQQYPVLKEIKEHLYNLGADYASMSGSGSAIYAISKKYLHLPEEWKKKWLVWDNFFERNN